MSLNLLIIEVLQAIFDHFLEKLYFSDFRIGYHFVGRQLIIILRQPFLDPLVQDDWIRDIS
jgi:hypothetical protein